MKQMTNYKPVSGDSTGITVSSEHATFSKANLKELYPSLCWKSTVITETIIQYDLGGSMTHNALFLNRFNFAEFYVETWNGSAWVVQEHVQNQTTDELHDEDYMHYLVDVTGTYQLIRVRIPAQTPLFEQTYFKIGNMLVGDMVQIWSPKSGFAVKEDPSRIFTKFKSGFTSSKKIGKTKRIFTASFDKFSKIEYNKIVKTYEPFVIYQEFENDKTQVYLVQKVTGYNKNYHMATTVNMPFNFEEIV